MQKQWQEAIIVSTWHIYSTINLMLRAKGLLSENNWENQQCWCSPNVSSSIFSCSGRVLPYLKCPQGCQVRYDKFQCILQYTRCHRRKFTSKNVYFTGFRVNLGQNSKGQIVICILSNKPGEKMEFSTKRQFIYLRLFEMDHKEY